MALSIADRCEYRLKQADIHNFLARLALDAGDRAEARRHAAIARERAWCDGPPHCYKPALDRRSGCWARSAHDASGLTLLVKALSFSGWIVAATGTGYGQIIVSADMMRDDLISCRCIVCEHSPRRVQYSRLVICRR